MPDTEPNPAFDDVPPTPSAVGASTSRLTPTVRFIAAPLLALLAAWTFHAYGPHILDDAYITFRYARNLAEGNGLVYNPGERVQGSSTPLFSVSLGALGFLGPPIPPMGVSLSVAAALATLVLLILAGRTLGIESAGWIAAFALATQFFWVLLLVSGMETTLYSALLMALFLAVGERRWPWIGILCALICLTRYDGVLAAAAALIIVLQQAGWKTALRQAVIAAALYLPWFIFAWIYFGSPVPQTIQAKQVINVLSWSAIFSHYQLFLDYSPLLEIWLGLFVAGLIVVAQHRPAWLVIPLWVFFYLVVFFLQRRPVLYYPWYLVPVLPPMLFLGAVGLREIVRVIFRKKPNLAPHALVVLAALAVLIQTAQLFGRQEEFGAHTLHRERKYQHAAEILQPHIRPGDSVYVGEVGTLGWFLPDAKILDSAGLLTPEVYRIRIRDRQRLDDEGRRPEDFPDGSPEVTRIVIRELRPGFITTAESFLFIQEIRNEVFFQDLYAPLEVSRLSPLGQVAFCRIAPGTEESRE